MLQTSCIVWKVSLKTIFLQIFSRGENIFPRIKELSHRRKNIFEKHKSKYLAFAFIFEANWLIEFFDIYAEKLCWIWKNIFYYRMIFPQKSNPIIDLSSLKQFSNWNLDQLGKLQFIRFNLKGFVEVVVVMKPLVGGSEYQIQGC